MTTTKNKTKKTKNKKVKPLHFRLGLGKVLIGIDSRTKVNPQITIKRSKEEFAIGTPMAFNKTPLEDAEVVLEIVGLEGLTTLKEMIKLAENRLKRELNVLDMWCEFEDVSSKWE